MNNSRIINSEDVTHDDALSLYNNYLVCADLAGIDPCDLYSHITGGNCYVWRQYPRTDIGFCGNVICDVFFVSHICIADRRDRYNYLLDLLYTTTPVVFAVPYRLANQLQRMGYGIFNIPVYVYFRGDFVQKFICINKSVKWHHIDMLLTYFDKTNKKDIVFKKYKKFITKPY